MLASNALPDILHRLDLPRDARVLDIGGAAYLGEESTRWLLEAFSGRVDVVGGKPGQLEAMALQFGQRVRLIASEAEAEEHAYDLIVVSPTLGKVMEWLTDIGWRAGRLVKPGGVVITFGLNPATLGATDYKQPDPAVSEAFLSAFGGRGGAPIELPSSLSADWSLMENVARKPAFRSYLTWLVLRRGKAAKAGSLTDGLAAEGVEAALPLLSGEDFDTLMIVDPSRLEDRRTQRMATALAAFGRKLIWVEAMGDTPALADGPGGRPLLRFPDLTTEIIRRSKAVGLQADVEQKAAASRTVLAGEIARLAERSALTGLIVSSQGVEAARVAHDAMLIYASAPGGAGRPLRWVHDVLDPRLDPGSMPGRVRPDAITAATADAAAAAPGAVRIYDVQALADRFRWRGATLRQKAEWEGQIVVYSGDGRGAKLDGLVEVAATVDGVQLALLAARGAASKVLRDQVQIRDGDPGLGIVAAPTPADVPGFIADADLGIIATDMNGQPEPSEIERFSDYLTAGIPVIAPEGGEVAALLDNWPVGLTYDPWRSGALAAAVRQGLQEKAVLASAITRRPDLQLDYAWETQAAKLRDIYRTLEV